MFDRIVLLMLIVLAVGCSDKKERYRVAPNGDEKGIAIKVLLEGGGTATLVCPKYDSSPISAHGRECYLDRYDKRVELVKEGNEGVEE